jgi:hypothetical protein
MKRMLDRLFGRDNVEELNSLLGIIHEHWLQYYKEGWALYLYTNNIPCAAIGEVFGCKEYWKSVNHVDDYWHAEGIYSSICHSGHYVPKVAIFNKEMVYFYKVTEHDGDVYISIGMSSLIYGRSNVHIADVIRPRNARDWEIKTLKYSRASEANGFMASLSECFRKIVDIELRSESPYESMKRAYPEEWHAVMHRQFIINLTPDGIRFNDYFGI